MSRSGLQSDLLVAGSDLQLRTLSTSGGTSRDTNTILSGSGWHMNGSRIQVTATSQATARDGHREGATLILDTPVGWKTDGSKGIVFVLDDWLWPSASASLMWFGAGLVDPLANQAAQTGAVLAAHDNTGPTVRLVQVTPNAHGSTSASLGGALTRLTVRILPLYNAGVLTFGIFCAYGNHSSPTVPGSELCAVRTDTFTSWKIALSAGFTGTSAGNARTMGARVRYAVFDTMPLTEVLT